MGPSLFPVRSNRPLSDLVVVSGSGQVGFKAYCLQSRFTAAVNCCSTVWLDAFRCRSYWRMLLRFSWPGRLTFISPITMSIALLFFSRVVK